MDAAEIFATVMALFWWVVLFISFERDRSRYRNCYFLFFALISTVVAVTMFADGHEGEALLAVTVLVGAAILMVPVFLIHNGVVMYKKEGHSLANLLSLLFGVAMVNLYRYTGTGANDSMLYTLSNAMAALFSGAYFMAAPLIGVLGAFMSGSNTVSNTLFASIQFETASILGMSQVLIVALQAMGGAIGNMICVHNIVAVCATTGTNGNEGRLIRTNIIPCLIYALTVAVVVGIFLKAGVNPMPELLS